MDYETAYKEALGWMRSIYPTLRGADKEDAEHYFPELRESEDERIRKVLIKYFKGSIGLGVAIDNVSVKDIVAWLEKQKEWKPAAEEVLIRAGLKPFKDGNQWCILVGDNIQEGMCGFGDTIEDALYEFLKDVCKQNKPAEWSEEDEEICRIIINRLTKFDEWASKQGYRDDPGLRRNPKDWLKSLRPQPKQDWSEEDLQHKSWILECLADGERTMPEYAEDFRAAYKWLKSLRPQPHWKPSEEQIEALERCVDYLDDSDNEDAAVIGSLCHDLKKL